MCGFIAVVSAARNSFDWATIKSMTEKLAHRGPDDCGYAFVNSMTGEISSWASQPPREGVGPGVAFGHRRLSILDLGRAGHQPLVSDDGKTVLVYNGEIYNFVELRHELEAIGVKFKSNCDTEVLLEVYRQWGTDGFSKLNGMWAFAIWDSRTHSLIVCRDRFGVKPLYYTELDGNWIFGSELKAILEIPGAHRGYNDANIVEFMSRGIIDHTHETLFRKIYSVSPGEYLNLHRGDVVRKKFWTIGGALRESQHEDAALIQEFRSLLSDSVRIRMRSDVPVGTMLSGGLDSTAITAFIDLHRNDDKLSIRQRDSAQTSSFHETFTACWPGAGHLNEEEAVAGLCDQLGLRSNRLYPTANQVGDLLTAVTVSLDQPFESPICAVQYGLMKLAHDRGIKVVLNGHGSDEILAGYPDNWVPTYLVSLLLGGRLSQFADEFRAFSSPRQWSAGAMATEALRALTPRSARAKAANFVRRLSQQRWGIFNQEGLLEQRNELEAVGTNGRSPLRALLWSAFSRNLVPQWLRMEDRVSMAHSVESRLPFMDYRVVEFAFNLDDSLKLRDGYTKFILRRSIEDLLPNNIAFQRRKQRFAAPFPKWFRGEWRELIQGALMTNSFHVKPYLNTSRFQAALQGYLAGDDSALDASMLWRILQTEIWMQAIRSR